MTKAKCDKFSILKKITRLDLTRKKDSPLSYGVKSCRWITKDGLKKLGYPVNSKHPNSMTYLLYSLREEEGISPNNF